jgi:hypothetical protein
VNHQQNTHPAPITVRAASPAEAAAMGAVLHRGPRRLDLSRRTHEPTDGHPRALGPARRRPQAAAPAPRRGRPGRTARNRCRRWTITGVRPRSAGTLTRGRRWRARSSRGSTTGTRRSAVFRMRRVLRLLMRSRQRARERYDRGSSRRKRPGRRRCFSDHYVEHLFDPRASRRGVGDRR